MFYISQINESDCGLASLKMLLANVFDEESFLFLPQNEEHGPYSYFDLIGIAKKYNVELEGLKIKEKEEFSKWNDFPIIVSFNEENYCHSSLILKRRGNKFLLLDPDTKPHWIKFDELIKKWDGTLLRVKSKPKTITKKPKVISIEKGDKLSLVAQILQIALSIVLLTSIFFLDEKYPFYISLGLIILYVALELLFRNILIKIMDKIDEAYVNGLTKVPNNSYLFLIRLNDFKKTFIANKISLISNLIIGLSLIFITIFNGYWNAIIVFVIILLSLIETFVTKPIFAKKDKKIALEEKKLSKVKSYIEFKEGFKKIKRASNKFAYLSTLKTIIYYSIILLTVFIVLSFTKNMSLVSLVFYFMISLILDKTINSIFEFQSKERDRKLIKAKLNNLY